MTYPLTLRALFLISVSLALGGMDASAQLSLTLQDIGGPAIPGATNPVSGGFDFNAGGSDIGQSGSDQFSFDYTQRTGDFDLKVRIAGLALSDAWAKAALMAREDLAPTNRYAASLATPDVSGCFFQSRLTNGQPALMSGSFPVTYPNTWLRLQRVGTNFTGYASVDGNAWLRLGTAAIAMPPTIYVGVAATSRNTGQATTVQVRDFQDVTTAAVSSLKLSREPIGPSSRKTGLAITEIMYHPRKVPGFSNSLEFIELYNSQAFYESIGGYSISGSVDFTFPSNTVLQSGSYLVVARDPAFVKSYYGITNVIGPWPGAETNGLPNNSGTVRLRNRQQAVMLEIKYAGANPWPIAADGSGHSLVLSHPTYGEADPRAWSASESIDGSPGRDDPYNTDPIGAVVINEFLAHTEDPLVADFVELYNHSAQPVDLSGAFLSDDATTNKFQIPNGTTIGPTGFVFFTENTLGFGLKATGQRIFLVNSNQTRVIDVVDYEPQANGVSSGRFPDGAPAFREMTSRTPGAPNSVPILRDIVINELMHSPISGSKDDEYLELYNKGANSVSLGGWQFTSGISFTFPSNTVIAPDGYLVVARNKTNLLARYAALNANNLVGDFSGKLSGGGERVALSRPEPWVTTNGLGGYVTNTIYVVENEVTYAKGGRWGTWSDGGGSSLELVDPRSDNRQPANWADSDETAKGQWVNFEFTGPLGETLGSPINDNVELALLDIGECLIDEVELHNGNGANLIANPGFESGTNSWVFQGSHDFSTIENTGYAGSKSLHLRAGSRGDNGANRIRTATLTTSASVSVTLRAKARWLRGWPEVLLRIHGGAAEVVGVMPTPLNLGTPGARNSQAVTNAGPAIWDVHHSPVLPAANEPVVITARSFDPDGIASLAVRYRLDAGQTTNINPALFNSLNMVDDGTGGDAVAGDGVYTATIPGQTGGATIGFYIQAVDTLSATNLFPQDVFPKPGFNRCFPNDAIARECVLRWGDAQMPGSFATYHLWLTFANSNRWAYRGRPTTADGGLNNTELDGTFVYNNARAVYNALPLYAGSPWHRGQMNTGPCGGQRVDYVMDFPSDDRMLGATDFVLNNPGNPGGTTTSDTSAQTEQTSYIIFNEIGVVYNHRRYIHYFINGSQRSTTSDRAGNFIFEDSQQPNGDMIAEWYPNDTGGELYKIEDWFEFNDNGYDFSSNNDADLLRRTILQNGQPTQVITPYRFMFRRRAVGPGDLTSNYTNFFNLVNAASPTSDYGTAGTLNAAKIPNPAAFDAIANYEQWMRIFACQHTVGNWDSYGFQRGKNDYTYKGQNGRFEQMTWDIDFTMGVGGQPATDDLFSSTINDPRVRGMLATPAIVRAYWRAYQDIINGPLNQSFLNPILDAKAAALKLNNINTDPNTLATVKTYITARHNYIQTQLNGVTVGFSAGPGFVSSGNNLYSLSGTAPISIKTMIATVNNLTYSISFTNATSWLLRLAMNPGTNVVVIQSYDRFGNELLNYRTTNTFNYTGPILYPENALVINEVMFNPIVPKASYLEIYNNSDGAFDLSNWRLDGLSYTFPIGAILPGRGFLVLAENLAAYASAYPGAVSPFGQVNAPFNAAGQTLALVRPGATAIDDLVVNKIHHELTAPWPAGPGSQGLALQVIDPSQDNARVSNWGDGTGWRFASITANLGSLTNADNFSTTTNLLIFMQNGGDAYIDDVSFVPLSGALAGANVIQNGDFEGPLSGPWVVPATMGSSLITNTFAHSGGSSLHVVATNGGSPANSIKQLLPPLETNILCTLSFWYHSGANTNMLVRTLGGTQFTTNVNLKPLPSTPGIANLTLSSLPPYPLLWLNEVQGNNATGPKDAFGERDPWIELYNSGTNTVALDGFYLANNYDTNLTQWQFPAGSSINPGQFILIWGDGQPGQSSPTEWHTSFRLNSSTGSVALVRLVSGAAQIVDYLNYSGLEADQSYGNFPDGEPFDRRVFATTATPGANNVVPPVSVLINEWLADNKAGAGGYLDPLTGKYDDWFELYNADPGVAANIGGFYLSGDLANPLNWRIPDGTIIPPGGYLLAWADNVPALDGIDGAGNLHVNFKLNKGGDSIGLFALSGTNILRIDAITFGPQNTDISQGRYPDGSRDIYFLSTPTPRASNVTPANYPPVLAPIGDKTVFEGTLLIFTNSSTDADLPPQTLTYSLLVQLPGAVIDPGTGVFRWTPPEVAAPIKIGPIAVIVTDNGNPSLSATQSFAVTVLKTNSPPAFPPQSNPYKYFAQPLLPLHVTNIVTDPDLPPNHVTFQIVDAPKGVRINSHSGVLTWVPTTAQAGTTNSISILATDDGAPSLSATNSFQIIVTDYLELSLGRVVLLTGRTGSVPVTVTNSAPVTNISSVLFVPPDRLTNLSLTGWAPELQAATLSAQAPGFSQLAFSAANGQVFQPGQLLAQLNFTAISTQSAFVPLVISNIIAIQSNGIALARTLASPGRAVVVAGEPLGEALPPTNTQPLLVLYGQTGSNYLLQFNSDPALMTNHWKPSLQKTLTNLFDFIQPPLTNDGVLLFRFIQQ